MSQPLDQQPGSTLADSIVKVLDFAAQSGHPLPRMGADIEPVEVEVSKHDGALVVRARENELVSIEVASSLRASPGEMTSLIVEVANEALALAREETMQQFESMPSLQTIQDNVAALQREVNESYRTEMARLAEMTKGLSS